MVGVDAHRRDGDDVDPGRVDGGAPAGCQSKTYLRPCATHRGAQFPAIHTGPHAHVGDNDVESIALEVADCFLARLSHDDDVSRGSQQPLQRFGHGRLVVDSQDA